MCSAHCALHLIYLANLKLILCSNLNFELTVNDRKVIKKKTAKVRKILKMTKMILTVVIYQNINYLIVNLIQKKAHQARRRKAEKQKTSVLEELDQDRST